MFWGDLVILYNRYCLCVRTCPLVLCPLLLLSLCCHKFIPPIGFVPFSTLFPLPSLNIPSLNIFLPASSTVHKSNLSTVTEYCSIVFHLFYNLFLCSFVHTYFAWSLRILSWAKRHVPVSNLRDGDRSLSATILAQTLFQPPRPQAINVVWPRDLSPLALLSQSQTPSWPRTTQPTNKVPSTALALFLKNTLGAGEDGGLDERLTWVIDLCSLRNRNPQPMRCVHV